MKAIASIVVALAFVATAQAEDMNKNDAAPTKTQAPPAAARPRGPPAG